MPGIVDLDSSVSEKNTDLRDQMLLKVLFIFHTRIMQQMRRFGERPIEPLESIVNY